MCARKSELCPPEEYYFSSTAPPRSFADKNSQANQPLVLARVNKREEAQETWCPPKPSGISCTLLSRCFADDPGLSRANRVRTEKSRADSPSRGIAAGGRGPDWEKQSVASVDPEASTHAGRSEDVRHLLPVLVAHGPAARGAHTRGG